MEYYLKSLSSAKIEKISNQKFNELKNSYDSCVSAMLFEESIHLVLTNYIEYESFLLNCSLKNGLLKFDTAHIREARFEVNRLISNILSIVYNYMMYANILVNKITGKDIFNKQKARMFVSDIEFNFMEELRNYTQHYSFPMHSITIDNRWEEINKKELSRNFLVKPFVDLSTLLKKKSFIEYSRSTKANLKREASIKGIMKHYNSDKADLTKLTRHYMNCVWSLHKKIREKIVSSIQRDTTNIKLAIQSMNEKVTGNVGCIIEKKYKKRAIQISLANRVLEDYKYLLDKYSIFDLNKIYISNQYDD